MSNGFDKPADAPFFWSRTLRRFQEQSARQRRLVRFRLSREGFHFVLILLFILVGAVLRDISLLVLLAGVMFALLLIQWRLGKRSIANLELKRELPETVPCGVSVDFRITVFNRRRWLGSYLLTIQDQIEQVAPLKKLGDEKVLTVIDDVAPGHHRQSTLQVVFKQRGHYRVGPTTLSTAFPLNLGTSSRQYLDVETIVVHPALGALTNRCHELFRVDKQGLSRTIARAGVNEGEFFGLRQWQNGDSQRWIHWRTTARLGELSVRQFEQQQRMQSIVILDLHERSDVDSSRQDFSKIDSSQQDSSRISSIISNSAQQDIGKPDGGKIEPDRFTNGSSDWAVERAISFVATLAVELVGRGRHKMSVAIAGREVVALPNVQSPILVNDLLDHLASASSTTQDVLPMALEKLQASLVRNPQLILVSTRSNALPQILRNMPDSMNKRILERTSLRWLNVAADDLEPYFQWSDNKLFASVNS